MNVCRVRRLVPLLVAVAATSALACGCTGGARRPARDGASTTDSGNATRSQPAPADVVLTDADLAPMDAYIRRRFWILGDDVEIVASKEYFVQNLSIAARIGLVKREDTDGKDEARSVLTFLGSREQVDFDTAPRVMIGTGITVAARRQIVLRFVRTTDANLPIRLRIVAHGDGRLGVGNEVRRRDPTIAIGAQIRRGADGAYGFVEE